MACGNHRHAGPQTVAVEVARDQSGPRLLFGPSEGSAGMAAWGPPGTRTQRGHGHHAHDPELVDLSQSSERHSRLLDLGLPGVRRLRRPPFGPVPSPGCLEPPGHHAVTSRRAKTTVARARPAVTSGVPPATNASSSRPGNTLPAGVQAFCTRCSNGPAQAMPTA